MLVHLVAFSQQNYPKRDACTGRLLRLFLYQNKETHFVVALEILDNWSPHLMCYQAEPAGQQ